MHVVRRAYTNLMLEAHPETAQDGGSMARLLEVTLLLHPGLPIHSMCDMNFLLHMVGHTFGQ